MVPLVLSKVGVKGSKLHLEQSKRKSWPNLMQITTLSRIEFIAMMAEEDEITLIVECHHATSYKFGRLGE